MAAQTLLYTTHVSRTFQGVTRHAMSTDTAGTFSMPWDRLDVGWTCRDIHRQSSRPPDTTCVGTSDMLGHTPDKPPFLRVPYQFSLSHSEHATQIHVYTTGTMLAKIKRHAYFLAVGLLAEKPHSVLLRLLPTLQNHPVFRFFTAFFAFASCSALWPVFGHALFCCFSCVASGLPANPAFFSSSLETALPCCPAFLRNSASLRS